MNNVYTLNNVSISKLSFLWEYMLLQHEKKVSVACINDVRINIPTDFILSIRFCDIITQRGSYYGLVNSFLNLPDGQVKFWGEFVLQKNGNQSCSSRKISG